MITISILILSVYSFILLWLVIGVYRLKTFRGTEAAVFQSFSIIIPFRNEGQHLERLCNSLLELDYPADRFEVLFVDDDSEDNSVDIIQNTLCDSHLHWSILKNERHSASPKKDAISLAADSAIHKWILTTDADCRVPVSWLGSLNSFVLRYDPYMVCGPVIVSSSWAGSLQSLENISLQGVTMGSFGWKNPVLCNGANLAFRADIFSEVGKYAGNEHIASGDDIFLMTKFRQAYPDKVSYLKDERAIIYTEGVKGLGNVIRQRVRWAKKTSSVKNSLSKLIGFAVFLTNLLIIILTGLAVVDKHYLFPAALSFGIKIAIDNIYIQEINRFFKRRLLSLPVILNGLLYPFLSVLVVVLSWFRGYSWKGRYHRR